MCLCVIDDKLLKKVFILENCKIITQCLALVRFYPRNGGGGGGIPSQFSTPTTNFCFVFVPFLKANISLTRHKNASLFVTQINHSKYFYPAAIIKCVVLHSQQQR